MRSSVSLSGFVLAVVAPLLTGCSTGLGPAASVSSARGEIQGKVRGGQQPVSGATIQLWAISVSGDGSAATPLLTSTVTTDSNGNFTITGLYSCGTYSSGPLSGDSEEVYLTATGGNPGLASGTNNTALALMSPVGSCASLNSSSFLVINEATTIAAVSQLYPYMTSYSAVGAGSSDLAAMVTALNVAGGVTGVQSLVDVSSGTSVGSPGGDATSEKIDTLSNILAQCINSTGGVSGDGSACGNLFLQAKPSSGPAPTDTVTAALDIAENSGQNVAGLFALAPAVGPFQPVLTTTPFSWTVVQIPVVVNQEATVVVTTAPNTGIVATPGEFTFTTTYTGSSTQSVTFTPTLLPATLPIILSICQTNGAGSCLAALSPSVTVQVTSGATLTFRVQVENPAVAGTVPYNPDTNLIFVQITDQSGNVIGLGSVPVTANPADSLG